MESCPHSVLVIDDDPSTQATVRELLESWHCSVTCTSVTLGWQLLQQGLECYDLVIADRTLQARRSQATPQQGFAWNGATRFILTTDQPTTQWVRQTLKAGVLDILAKPLDGQELRQVLAEALVSCRQSGTSSSLDASGSTAAHQTRDVVTGLLSHRAFIEALADLRSHCRHQSQPLSLLLVDVDRFRELNRTYSHELGDLALQWLAGSLTRTFRDADLIARYGSDRFAVAVPGTSEQKACDIAWRFVENLGLQYLQAGGNHIHLQVHGGVATSDAGFLESEHDLLDRAEQSLAAAKQRGPQERIVGYSTLNMNMPSWRQISQASLGDLSRWIQQARQQLKLTYVESTRALVNAVEAKDPYTQRHSLTVSHVAEALGACLDMPANQIDSLKIAAMLHDVGKIGVPGTILRKPGRLNASEYRTVQEHPQTALQILGHATFLTGELPLILHHHERFDGQGYPAGLSGEDIPFGARVLAVADSMDAMFAHRSYKQPLSIEQARTELNKHAGQQWDPGVVEAALDWLDTEPLVPRDVAEADPTTTESLLPTPAPADDDPSLLTPPGDMARRLTAIRTTPARKNPSQPESAGAYSQLG